jgi:predicted DNA-binding transcriptional regulator AlpA
MGSNHDAFAGWLVRDERRLLTRDEVLALLNLSNEKVDQLINTRQITAIRIAGEERFDSRDIDQLIESYKSTASRRPS